MVPGVEPLAAWLTGEEVAALTPPLPPAVCPLSLGAPSVGSNGRPEGMKLLTQGPISLPG